MKTTKYQLTTRADGTVIPCAANVHRLRPFGWADFKHKLVEIGVLTSTYDDCPVAWQMAYKGAFR